MLTLTYRILVLLQSMKYSSQLQPPLRMSKYWQTTYISDKVPDYWNHGSIYVPANRQRKTEDIFSSWLARAITEPSSRITETTPIEDYEIYIFKTSVDNTIKINNAKIDNENENLKAYLASSTASIPMPQTKLTRTVPRVITLAKESKSNSIITNSIFIRALSIKNDDFTRSEYETTLDDFDNDPPFTKNNSIVITSTEESIILESILSTTTSRPEINQFTRPEYDTTIDDNDAHPTSTKIHSTVTAKKIDSLITDSIVTTTTPRSDKNHFTRAEYDTTFDDYDAHRSSTTIHSTVKTEEFNSIITDGIYTKTPPTPEKERFTHLEYETTVYGDNDNTYFPVSTINPSVILTTLNEPISNFIITNSLIITAKKDDTHPQFETRNYDDDTHLMSTTKALSLITPYETAIDNDAHPNYDSRTQLTSTPEYDTTIYDDPHANSVSMIQASTPDYDATNYDAYPIFTTMTQPPTTNYQTTQKEILTIITGQIPSSKADSTPLIRPVNQEMTSDPFSIFLRKLLIVLSVKRLEDLPVLVNQFSEYLWMLLRDGHVGKLGLYINSYLAHMVLLLEEYPIEELRNLIDKYHKMLANRNKLLPKDINDILDYMDDTYDESEEEAMQAVLNEASLFPNSKHNNKVAQGFVDYVFLKPMQRVIGTTRGKVLFKMMTEAVKVRDKLKDWHNFPKGADEFRKRLNFGKTRSYLSKSLDWSSSELPILKQLHSRKDEDNESKSDSSIEKSSEKSKIIKSQDHINEHSDETENSEESKESKYYRFKENAKIFARNGRQYRAFTSTNQGTPRATKIKTFLSKFRNSRYTLKTKLRLLDNNIKNQQNALPNRHRRTTTVNSARFNIEKKLKRKINDKFKRMNFSNYNASRRMKHSFTPTINAPDDSHETDVERVLKKNIYKAMNKLLDTNTYKKSPQKR